jgi:hypothetical protein
MRVREPYIRSNIIFGVELLYPAYLWWVMTVSWLCYVMDERQGAIYQVQCYLWCRMTVSWISVVGNDCILDICGG